MLPATQQKFICPGCSSEYALKLNLPLAICCKKCSCTFGIDADNHIEGLDYKDKVLSFISVVDIGTTGSHNNKTFEIAGHIRSINSDCISNEWLMLFSDGAILWLTEVGGSYFIYNPISTAIDSQIIKNKKAGSTVTIDRKDFIITGISKQTEFQMQGQIPLASFQVEPYFKCDLSAVDNTALATIAVYDDKTVEIIYGYKIDIEKLEISTLKNSTPHFITWKH